MRPKADTDQGYFKLADELLKDLVLADLTLYELKTCLLVVGHTYARKVRAAGAAHPTPLKVTPYSARGLARAGALDHRGVARAVRRLLDARVLISDGQGRIGINTRAGDWNIAIAAGGWDTGVRGPDGWAKVIHKVIHSGDAHPRGCPSPGTTIPGSGDAHPRKRGCPSPPLRTRAEESRRGRGGARKRTPQTPAPQVLPNGRTDTPRNRASLGHPDFPPMDHPAFTRLAFPLQERLERDWEAGQTKAKTAAPERCPDCRKRPAARGVPGGYCRDCWKERR